MIICKDCPYKGRCEIKQRCIQGKNNAPDMTPTPKPSKFVNTTGGNVETAGKRGAPIKTILQSVGIQKPDANVSTKFSGSKKKVTSSDG